MQGRTAANGAHHLHARAFAESAFYVDDLVALAHAQVDRLLDLFVQFAHGQQRGVAHAQAPLDQVAEFEQAHAQPVGPGCGPFDQAPQHQIVEDAVRSGRVQAGAFADVLERDRLFVLGQHFKQIKHAFEHLHAGLGWRDGERRFGRDAVHKIGP